MNIRHTPDHHTPPLSSDDPTLSLNSTGVRAYDAEINSNVRVDVRQLFE
jgi:hypothetical protein